MGWKRNRRSGLDPGSSAQAVRAASGVLQQPGLVRVAVRDQGQSGLNPASGPEAVNIPSWMINNELPPLVSGPVQTGPNSELGLGVVNIPAADGYHFSDDHPWGAEQQSALVTRLTELENRINPS